MSFKDLASTEKSISDQKPAAKADPKAPSVASAPKPAADAAKATS